MTLHPYDFIIAGDGLAGITRVIHIAKSNFKELSIEKTQAKNIKFVVSLYLIKYCPI
jgi:thioredoxin reductase